MNFDNRYELAQKVWNIVTPIVVVVGTVGNLVIMAVFSRQAFSRSTLALCMRFMAVAQIVFFYTIYTIPPIHWTVRDVAGDRLYTQSDGWCKFMIIVTQPRIYQHFAVFSLTILSVDRALALLQPHRRREIISRRNIKFVTSSYVAWEYFIRLPFLEARIADIPNTDLMYNLGLELNRSDTSRVCHLPSYTFPIRNASVYRSVDVFLSESVLSIVMATSAALACYQLYLKASAKKVMLTSRYKQAFKFVLVNVVSYFILHTPEQLLYLRWVFTQTHLSKYIYVYCKLLVLIHHSGTFFICCLPTIGFRKELKNMLLCPRLEIIFPSSRRSLASDNTHATCTIYTDL